MTDALLDAVDLLLEAILSGGRGYDGALGPRAQQAALPTGSSAVFTRCDRPLEQITELNVFDCGYHLAPSSGQTPLYLQSSYNPRQLETVRYVLTLGVLYGTQQPEAHFHLYSGESLALARQQPARRLAGLEARARQALTWPELYEDATRDPPVQLVTLDAGETVDLDAGRMVRVIPVTVLLDRRNAAYQPSPTP